MRLAFVLLVPIGLGRLGAVDWEAAVAEQRVTIPQTVTVPAGPYDWRPPGDRLKNGGPVDPPLLERVAEAPLGVMTFQVSRSEFAACVAAGACEDTGADLSQGGLPMVQVNLADAQGYARCLSDATGETRRLQRAAAERFVVDATVRSGLETCDPGRRLNSTCARNTEGPGTRCSRSGRAGRPA